MLDFRHTTRPRTTPVPDELEEHLVDFKGVDLEYVENVRVYLDRGFDLYHFPRESAERLGRLADDGENYLLMADWIEARAEHIEVGGSRVPVWTAPVNQFVTRPSARQS